jgi:hypothetical protein
VTRVSAFIAATVVLAGLTLAGCTEPEQPPSDGIYEPNEQPDVIDENGQDVDAPEPEPEAVQIIGCELEGGTTVRITTSGESVDNQVHQYMVIFEVNGVETLWTPIMAVPTDVLEFHKGNSPEAFDALVPVPEGTSDVVCSVKYVS